MDATYTLRDAKARLSELLDRVAAGQEVEIVRQGARGGRFRVLAVDAAGAARRPGRLAGRIAAPDGFDDEDAAVTAAFEGRG